MTMYYEIVKSVLTDDPQTGREITQQIYPDLTGKELMRCKQRVVRALYDLRNHKVASSSKIDGIMYWTLYDGSEVEVQTVQRVNADVRTRIRIILSDGEWHTTRKIAEALYSDFNEPYRSVVYTARTNCTLNKMHQTGDLDKMYSKSVSCVKAAMWRIKGVTA